MYSAKRFQYTNINPPSGEASLLPYLPLTLTYKNCSRAMTGLLDTGATVNVLPHHLGLSLGAEWRYDSPAITLTGNLARFEARPIVVMISVGHFPPVRLAFAWAQSDDVPLLLGQINFFMEFDVCFYRSQQAFEVKPKS